MKKDGQTLSATKTGQYGGNSVEGHEARVVG